MKLYVYFKITSILSYIIEQKSYLLLSTRYFLTSPYALQAMFIHSVVNSPKETTIHSTYYSKFSSFK